MVKTDVLPIFWREGANGKSTLIGTISALMGDYAKWASSYLLMSKRKDTHPTGIADLAGSRMVIAVETDADKKLAEALAKEMSGGDKQKARFMRQDYFEFDQTF